MKSLPNTSDFNKFNYNAGNLSSVSGFLPIFNYVQSTGLLQDLESIPFDDNRKNPLYSNYDIMLSKLTFNLTGLWGSTSRHQLGNDPLLENILIPSQSTDSKFQSRITEESVEALSTVLTNQACTWVVSHQTEVVLDQDSTVIETYGQQEYSAFIPHYQVAGFHPLLLTESHSQLILAAQNRPGNSHASMGSWEQLNPVIQKLRSENPDLLLCCLSYNIFHFFQQDVLEGKDKSMRMNTYRIYLGSIAAKVTRHCRQRFLSFASNFWNLDKFSYYLEKTHRLLLTT